MTTTVYYWYFRPKRENEDNNKKLIENILQNEPKYTMWDKFITRTKNKCIKDINNEEDIENTIKPCVLDSYTTYAKIPGIADYDKLSSAFIGYCFGIAILIVALVGFCPLLYNFFKADGIVTTFEFLVLLFFIAGFLGGLITCSVFLSNFIKEGKFEKMKQVEDNEFWK